MWERTMSRTPEEQRPRTPKENGQQKPPTIGWVIWAMLIGMVIFGTFIMFPSGTDSAEITYSALQREVQSGNVEQIELTGLEATGTFVDEVRIHDGRVLQPGEQPTDDGVTASEIEPVPAFESTIPEAAQTDFLAMLDRQNVEISAATPSEGWNIPLILLLGLPILIILGLIIFMSRSGGAGRGTSEFMNFTKSKARLYDTTKPKITFADVAGEDQSKSELMQVVDFLKNPKKFHEIGAKLPRGVLLVGPPGTGKTLLARAVAGEAGVPFYSVSASEFVEMFVGVGAGRVRDLFEKAKKAAPAIVFIDELDAVGRQRFAGVGSGNDEREQTLNQVLVEMDGFEVQDEVIVMAATNRPDVLDPALLRPGRFDRQVALGLPDRRARVAILGIHLKRVPLGENVDPEVLARSTPGFSGADLANLVNEAALIAARKNKKVVEQQEFHDALDRIILGAERPLVLTEHDKRVIAYHEAGHAVVAHFIPEADPLRMVSIIPRGQSLGVTMQAPSEDRFNYSRGYLKGKLAILMGGRAAEGLIFDEMTTGAQNDLKEATHIARRMVGLWGMSEPIGPYYLGLGEEHVFLGREMRQERSLSDDLLAQAEAASRQILREAVDAATELVTRYRPEMDRLVDRLMEEETLSRDQIIEILSGQPEQEFEEQPEPVPEPSAARAASFAASRRAELP
ncbi:MAG: ATP-dependent metallopeptidase FtsH/Yme1/Tma family protein [Sphaerobacteraceae bacterium]|nr:MAG: ATP-dependent metallopeptidase FtsH/Yme1/Tma family protein [Sphaerobacteraceae bacterium]